MSEFAATTPVLQRQNANLELDTRRMVVTKDGVSDYFWPVPNKVREHFYDRLLDDYYLLIRQIGLTTLELTPYKLLAKQLICETVGVFWADILRDGFVRSGIAPQIPAHFRLWSALFNEKVPEDHPLLTALHCRTSKKAQNLNQKLQALLGKFKKALKILSFKGNGLYVDGMRITPLTDHVLDNSIIVTQRTPLLREQIKSLPDDYIFCRSDRWYSEITKQQVEDSKKYAFEIFEDRYMRLIEKHYEISGLKIPEYSRQYLINMLHTGAALIREHLKRLDTQKIPRRIWTGSGGNIWDCMLRIKCRERGGHAVGHDHGAGLAHVDNPYMGLLEFWACDKFVTFNDHQAERLVKDQTQLICVDGFMPEVVGRKTSAEKHKALVYPKFAPASKVQTIAIMADIYDGDRGRGGPYGPDIMYADWQARLIGKLKDWGYSPILKIHPESKIMPPPGITDTLGARLETQPIEKIMDQVDLVLFDCLYTTAFRSIISTNIPMVFVDFYNHPWTETGLSLVKRRCGFVDAGYDTENRPDINWNGLKEAIEKAPSLNNNSDFYDFYYA